MVVIECVMWCGVAWSGIGYGSGNNGGVGGGGVEKISMNVWCWLVVT